MVDGRIKRPFSICRFGLIIGLMPSFASSPLIIWETRAPEFRALPADLPVDPPGEARDTIGGVGPEQREAWIERLAVLRVTADRATSPDLLGQLRLAAGGSIDTIVCSCLDEDPLLRPNAVMAARYPHALALGLELLGKLFDAKRMWVIFDAASPARWVVRARHTTKRCGARSISLYNDYPQSDPTLLLHQLMSRRLAPGRPPPDAGVVLLDAAAAVAIGQALHGGQIEQWPLAIRDHITGVSHYLSINHGRAIGHVLESAGVHPAATLLWAGRPLRNIPVEGHATLCGHELVFHAAPPPLAINPRVCIRCGWCLDACPMHIHPAGILEAAQRNNLRRAKRHGLDACIECGLCTYVCPSQLPLLEGVRTIKRHSEES
jgi:electron transport complex protein RnfC